MDLKPLLEKIKPYIAILILVFVIFTCVLLYQENKITREISENCGWGEEDFFCFCEKGLAHELRDIAEGGFNLSDVRLVE